MRESSGLSLSLIGLRQPPRRVGDANVVIAGLTPRQRELVRALLAGSTNRQIAARLGLREQTVRNQLSVLYNKLGVRNRLELAVHAGRYWLLDHTKDD